MFEWHARLIERAAMSLAHFAGSTERERLSWKPQAEESSCCRSATEQLDECIGVNFGFAAVLSGGTPPERSGEGAATQKDPEELERLVQESGARLAAVVRGMTVEDLRKTYDMGWAKLSGSVAIDLALANMHYHIGQINYIQTLYGDSDFHAPEAFFSFPV